MARKKDEIVRLKKRATELQVLASKTAPLFEQEKTDDVYKLAGEILARKLGYVNAILVVEGEKCVLKYVTMSDEEKEATRKFSGLDADDFVISYEREYYGRFEEEPVFFPESRVLVKGFMNYFIAGMPGVKKKIAAGGAEGLIDAISKDIFPHINTKAIVSPMKSGPETAGFVAVFGDALYEEDMPTIQHYSQIINSAVRYTVARQAVKKRLESEKTVSAISSRFVRLTDIDEAMNASLAEMGRLSGASRAYLFRFREEFAYMENTHEWCAEGVSPEIENLQKLETADFPWWMEKLKNGEIIHIKDVSKMPVDAAAEKKILEAQDIKSLLVLPVYFETELAGFMGFDNVMESAEWSDENLLLLRTCSEIIGNALEREWKEKALKESEERFRSLFEFSPDSIILIGLDGKSVDVNPMTEVLTGFSREELLGKGMGELSLLAEEDRFELLGLIKDAISGKEPGIMEAAALRKDRERRWAEIKVSQVKTETEVIGIQIRTRDITERKNAEEQLKKMSQKIISMQEEESGRLARELHDEVGQQITAMSLGLELMKEQSGQDGKYVEEMSAIVESLSEKIRGVCKGLRPALLDSMGLESALESLAWEFKQRGNIELELSIDRIGKDISPDISIGIYRVFQEALTNVTRHSGAKNVYVGLRKIDSDIILEVKDDGKGFADEVATGSRGFGIIGMRERAAMCGGRLEIQSVPGEGTHLVMGVPVK